jgi:cyclic beta-1,2-glucan synthetase
MYRVALETLLGFTKRGDTLSFAPVLPHAWPECELEYRHGGTLYRIHLVEPGALAERGVDVTLDGARLEMPAIALVDDGGTHVVEIRPRERAS